jgi:hypothetical protein
MPRRYVYKNVNNRPVNIGGYQFEEGQELESDVRISGFNEAVSNGFLELTEREPQGAKPDATPAPQTGNTGKVKVIFHMGVDAEGKEAIKEVETDPDVPVEFPGIDLREKEIFEGWFKDAEFTRPINADKARASRKGDRHFYGKYSMKPVDPRKSPNPDESANMNGGDDSAGDNRQVTLPSLPSPSIPAPPVGGKSAETGSENK